MFCKLVNMPYDVLCDQNIFGRYENLGGESDFSFVRKRPFGGYEGRSGHHFKWHFYESISDNFP